MRFSSFHRPLIVACAAMMSTVILAAAFGGVNLLRVIAMETAYTVGETIVPHDDQGLTNILILGVGDKTHTAADLTDTMMVASIDPSTRSVMLLSIPRDLFVFDATETAPSRINAIYANEKHKLRLDKSITASGVSVLALQKTAEAVSRIIAVPIQGVVKIDFSGLEQIVDDVDGVDIDVPDAIVDETYPVSEGVVGRISFEKGMQHMDGKTALIYARSRHSTSDFDRSARQQQIIRAIGEKIRSVGISGQLSLAQSLLQSVSQNVEMTFSTPEALALAALGSGIPPHAVIGMQINASTGNDSIAPRPGGLIGAPADGEFGTGAILLPYDRTTGGYGWTQIRLLANLFFYHRELYRNPPEIRIVAAETPAFNVTRLKNDLLRYGLTVVDTNKTDAHALVPGVVASYDQSDGAHALATLLKLPESDSSLTGTGADLVIGLAKYNFSPLKLPKTPGSQEK